MQNCCLNRRPTPPHLLSVHRERPRAVPHDHPNCHDALRDQKGVPPYEVRHADQRAYAPPPQVGGHADEVDYSARANPPRRGGALNVLGLEHVPRPVGDTGCVGLGSGTVVHRKEFLYRVIHLLVNEMKNQLGSTVAPTPPFFLCSTSARSRMCTTNFSYCTFVVFFVWDYRNGLSYSRIIGTVAPQPASSTARCPPGVARRLLANAKRPGPTQTS